MERNGNEHGEKGALDIQEDGEKRMRGQTVNKQWRVKTKGEP